MADLADWYTPRVSRRAELALALRNKGPDFLAASRIRVADLDALIRLGEEARTADREQQAQLAQAKAERAERSASASDVSEREDDLAATLPAVIHDLKVAGHGADASFLAKLSFARYRTRVHDVPVEAPTEAEQTTLRTIERVQKSDIATRAQGLSALCTTLVTRPTILSALTDRGLDAAALRALADDAAAVGAAGHNPARPVEATERERAAVRAQKIQWSATRNLIRRACRGDRELEALLAGC